VNKNVLLCALLALLAFNPGCGYVKDIARDSALAIYEKAKPEVENNMLVLADRVADRMVAKGDEIKMAADAAKEDGELLKYLLLAVLGHVSVTGGAELRKLVRDKKKKK
jgi:hypothetical protein